MIWVVLLSSGCCVVAGAWYRVVGVCRGRQLQSCAVCLGDCQCTMWCTECAYTVMCCAVKCLQQLYVHAVYHVPLCLCPALHCSGPDAAPADLPSTISQLLTSAVSSGDVESAAYWTYHLARTGFFTATVSARIC